METFFNRQLNDKQNTRKNANKVKQIRILLFLDVINGFSKRKNKKNISCILGTSSSHEENVNDIKNVFC